MLNVESFRTKLIGQLILILARAFGFWRCAFFSCRKWPWLEDDKPELDRNNFGCRSAPESYHEVFIFYEVSPVDYQSLFLANHMISYWHFLVLGRNGLTMLK